ncbi:helix-turn-helix transcriptional regulator [Pseudazoarcus pumilus]|uniref:HTH cro/C1-type domain-containing protein n=1 Tax=Pseudazoarcus pumilus TaxID=2067960 RepID=A0A2I6S837_9RHOO|nr:helix-turn-helix transcriptional regulator [Pseudazoarcus pumilus]AUN95424.1 hypothetical protein C0099_11085 [Pseudazoarcus pumilus]
MKAASQILADNIALVLHKSQHSANAAGKKSGVGQTTISNWIRKAHDADPKFNPRVEQLEAFARAFGYSVADLFQENLGKSAQGVEDTKASYAAAHPSPFTSPEAEQLIERIHALEAAGSSSPQLYHAIEAVIDLVAPSTSPSDYAALRGAIDDRD